VATSGLPTAASAGRKTALSARWARCRRARSSRSAGRPLTTTSRQSVVSTSSGEFQRKCRLHAVRNPPTAASTRTPVDHCGRVSA
jgi:hypothetical protein